MDLASGVGVDQMTNTATTEEDMSELDAVQMSRLDVGTYYLKSQPSALNMANNTIPENEVWSSSPVVYADDALLPPDADRPSVLLEIDLDEIRPFTPPDGGWGWMIVLGSFLCMFLVDGVCFSYGIFLSELESSFNASKMQMTLAGSLLTGCYFMVGPLVGGLMNRFGARPLVICGSAMSSLAILASSFAPNVNCFIGLFGVLGGLGYGLLYLPAATIVTSWFVKKRATVTGLITAGSGIGMTCYSLVIPHLIDRYTWRGCIFLLAAVNLNVMVAGALFRPLSSVQMHSTPSDPLDDRIASEKTSMLNGADVEQEYIAGASSFGLSGKSMKPPPNQMFPIQRKSSLKADILPNTGVNEMGSRQLSRRDTSMDDVIITHGNQLIPVPEGVALPSTLTDRFPMLSVEAVNHIVEEVLSRQQFVSSSSLAVPERVAKRKSSGLFTGSQRWITSTNSQLGALSVQPTENAVIYLKPDHMGSASYFASAVSLRTVGEGNMGPIDESAMREAIVRELRKEVARPGHRKDFFLSGSLMHVNEFTSALDVDTYMRTITAPAEEIQTRNPVIAMLRNMFGLSILRSPTFQLLNASSIISMIGYIIPYQFLKDNAQNLGYSDVDASYLLAYLGVLNTISRLLSGWLSDQSWVNVLLINNVSLIVTGAATAMVPLFKTYISLLSFACFYGFAVAPFITLRTILIVELLGLDRLTNVYGFLLLFQSITIIAAPPILGSFYDTFQTFDYTFLLGGIALFISGLLCLPLATLARWERRREWQTTRMGLDDDEAFTLDEETSQSLWDRLIRPFTSKLRRKVVSKPR